VITNIIRDIKADLKQGRVYLPQEDPRASASPSRCCRGRGDWCDQEALAHECQRAKFHAAAAQAMPQASRKLVGPRSWADYFEILQRIERGYDGSPSVRAEAAAGAHAVQIRAAVVRVWVSRSARA
jgi:phytoene/squalene synthetase